MDLKRHRHTFEEYRVLTKDIIGSLVCLSADCSKIFSMTIYKTGVGVVLEKRRYHGEIQLKVGWIVSPFIRFKEERKVGWHNYNRLEIISKKEIGKNGYQS